MRHVSKRQPGLFTRVCWLLVRLLVVMVFGCLVSIALTVVMTKITGTEATAVILNNEIQEAHDVIVVHVDNFEHSIMGRWENSIPAVNSSLPITLPIIAKTKQEQVWTVVQPFVNVMLLSVKLSLLRCYIILHWLLLFLILGIVGLSDGLSQRVIRRLSGGRESALIYHSAKSLVMMVLLCGVFLAIILPLSLVTISHVIIASFILSAGFIQ